MTHTQAQLSHLLFQPSPRFPSPLTQRLLITRPFLCLLAPFLRRDQIETHTTAPFAVDSVEFRNKICDRQARTARCVTYLLCFWESDKTQWLALRPSWV